MEEHEIRALISESKKFWYQRNVKFKSWFEFLILIDNLAKRGLESYVSNEPQTFYNMAHYLLTKGELTHYIPIESEVTVELDKRARVHRACQYMWNKIDRQRQLCGSQPFVDELGFSLLTLGWYSIIARFNEETGELELQIWNPADVYPLYHSNRLSSCIHSYQITESEAKLKAELNSWSYESRGTAQALVTLDDVFVLDKDNVLNNIVLIDGKPVTGWYRREEMKLLVAPVAGFPDRGSLYPGRRQWQTLAGRSIFEVNETVTSSFNKWRTMVTQILRDNVQPITQEFSATPQATPEQLRERGALFHYAPGEKGLERLPTPTIPIEVQANLLELRREMQKGSFSDAVYGMVEKQPGYAIGIMATSSANQILYPYMQGKHFVISECDRFWLSNLKNSNKTFEVKGKFLEKLKPEDIPSDVSLEVESNVATPKDWLERGTIANMLEKHLDDSTIITEILGMSDPQAIKRRKSLDRMLEHPMSQMVEMIAGYQAHADYLEARGDVRQAVLFRKAAQALEAQLGMPPPGSAKPVEATPAIAAREAGAPEEKTRVRPEIKPPEERSGFTPAELRERIGRGRIG